MTFQYSGGPILSNVKVVAIFAGSNSTVTTWDWHSLVDGSLLPVVSVLDRFLADIVDSSYVDKLSAEYSHRDGAPALTARG
jgi:hypothetical protein